MFWEICCCFSKQPKDDRSQQELQNSSYTGTEAPMSSPISVINTSFTNSSEEIIASQKMPPRERLDTVSSISSVTSMYSVKSFYSAKSTFSRNGDGDFYSICSEESYKST